LAHCIDEFQSHGSVSIGDVQVQRVGRGFVQYTVYGTLLRGGDIAYATLVLNVNEQTRKGFGGRPVKVYECSVVEN
jgi:hypothetical protein